MDGVFSVAAGSGSYRDLSCLDSLAPCHSTEPISFEEADRAVAPVQDWQMDKARASLQQRDTESARQRAELLVLRATVRALFEAAVAPSADHEALIDTTRKLVRGLLGTRHMNREDMPEEDSDLYLNVRFLVEDQLELANDAATTRSCLYKYDAHKDSGEYSLYRKEVGLCDADIPDLDLDMPALDGNDSSYASTTSSPPHFPQSNTSQSAMQTAG